MDQEQGKVREGGSAVSCAKGHPGCSISPEQRAASQGMGAHKMGNWGTRKGKTELVVDSEPGRSQRRDGMDEKLVLHLPCVDRHCIPRAPKTPSCASSEQLQLEMCCSCGSQPRALQLPCSVPK